MPRAVVRDYFDGRESVRMLSMLILVMGVAPIVAPFVGGQLLVHFGWRSVFLVLAGYGLTLLGLVAWLLPESLRPELRRRHAQARRRCERSAGVCAGIVQGDPACQTQIVVPHLRDHRPGADAVLAASIFHRRIHAIADVKAAMAAAGLPVRLVPEAVA